jgi:hypothetical protein
MTNFSRSLLEPVIISRTIEMICTPSEVSDSLDVNEMILIENNVGISIHTTDDILKYVHINWAMTHAQHSATEKTA